MRSLPLVSICIPTYEGGEFIERALQAVSDQDYPALEVVVVDDASRDDTVERIEKWRALGLRLVVHRRNRGHNATWNETVRLARGALIKFLHQDDVMREDCVARMAAMLSENPSAGMVFCRRRVVFDGVDEDAVQEWKAEYARPERSFARIASVNRGPSLFRQWLAANLSGNWIGEPTAVMVRRAAIETVGGFGHHLAQRADADLWLRVMARFDVCFIDEELVTYRYAASSLTGRNLASGDDWLDRLWILEGLAADREIAASFPELSELRRAERRQAFRTATRLGRVRGGARVPLAPYGDYLRFRAKDGIARSAMPYARIASSRA